MFVRAVAEIGEGDLCDLIMVGFINERHGKIGILARAVFLLQIPLAFFTPAEADGAVRDHNLFCFAVYGDSLPFRIIGLTKFVIKFGGTKEAFRYVLAVFFLTRRTSKGMSEYLRQ